MNRTTLLVALVTSTSVLIPAAVSAQSGATPVSVQEQDTEDLSPEVTAVNAASLRSQQIDDTSALPKAVPSLSVQAGDTPSNNGFRIRGIGASQLSVGLDPSVAVVVDGVVQARLAQNFTDLADIERVEVLGGPQGILFGRNASAGMINVITARPARAFEARSNLTIAEGNEYRANGTVSGPLTDTVRGRFTGFFNDVAGHRRNAADGSREGDQQSWGARGKLEWDPSDSLNLLATAEYRKTDSNCCQMALIAAQSPVRAAIFANAGVPIVRDNNVVWRNGLNYAYSEQQTFSVIAGLDINWSRIVTVTAIQNFSIDSNFEFDRLGASVPVFITPGGTAQFDDNFTSTDVRQLSQEIRLESREDNPLIYSVGAYVARVDLDRYASRRRATCATGTVGQPCLPANTRYLSLATDATLAHDHVAGFGRLETRIAGALSFIGGLRLQHEATKVSGAQRGVLVSGDAAFGGIFAPGSSRTSDSALTGKAGLKYEINPRAQVHAFYNRGYKGRGIDIDNTSEFANNPVIEAEQVDSYELGFKAATQDGRLNVAMTAFRARYDNLQVQANRSDPVIGNISFLPINADSSLTQGIEIEARIRPFKGFSVNAAVAYKKSELDATGLNCPIQSRNTALIIPLGGVRPVNRCYRHQFLDSSGALATSAPAQDVRDGDLPGAPNWRVNVSPRYETGLGKLMGFAQLDFSYQSDEQFAIEQDANQVQDGYIMVDASIGVRRPDARCTVTLFVKNLFDTNYYSNIQVLNLLPSNLDQVDRFALRLKNADRYIGGAVSYRF